MKQTKGITQNVSETLFGIYKTKNDVFKNNKILYCEKKPFITFGISAFVVPNGKKFPTNKPIIEIEQKPVFNDNDIISVNPEGNMVAVWEANTPHNALYVTDRCNSKCIMCPQVEGTLSRYDESLKILDLVSLKDVCSLGITGGEPTTNINKLVEVFKAIAKKSPNQKVHMLTHGRNFKNMSYVEKIANIENISISFGIPLYSAIAEEHDFIVGVKGAFNETIQGLYNLGKLNQNIEIRVVILRQNYKQLRLLANYIYRNIPFVRHIALMGMEYHGNAETNYDLVSIDPIEYKQELYEAVKDFVRYNMNVDVYNTPLCLADERIGSFCRDSISTWKKIYLPQCDECSCKTNCGGVFATSFKHSENIKPIL